MAASNLPWDLDVAVLRRYKASACCCGCLELNSSAIALRASHICTVARQNAVKWIRYDDVPSHRLHSALSLHGMTWLFRLEKRVMVPLPCAEAREQMVRKNLAGRASANLNYEEVHPEL